MSKRLPRTIQMLAPVKYRPKTGAFRHLTGQAMTDIIKAFAENRSI